MKWPFRRRRPAKPTPAPIAAPEQPEPRTFMCRYCGETFGVPSEHIDTPEHKLAQANALSPMARRAETDAMRDLNP